MKYISIIILFLSITINSFSQSKIRILDNTKIADNDSTYLLYYEFSIPIPTVFLGLPDKVATLNSFMPLYPGLDHLEGSDVIFKLSHEFHYIDSDTVIKNFLTYQYQNYQYGLEQLQVPTPDWIKGEYWDGTTWQCQD